jgi:hypothetical protein
MSEQRFIDNGDGTVSDSLTRLMWMQNDSYLDTKKFVTFTQAVKYTKKKNEDAFAGFTDWRIPDKKEAQTLYDQEKKLSDKYDIDIHIDSVFTPGCGFDTWTSNTRGKITAFVYSFNNGRGGHKEVDDILNTSVRLVRGEFDSSRVNLNKIPSVRDIITQGGGWR